MPTHLCLCPCFLLVFLCLCPCFLLVFFAFHSHSGSARTRLSASRTPQKRAGLAASALTLGGVSVNHLDIAPARAGLVFGIGIVHEPSCLSLHELPCLSCTWNCDLLPLHPCIPATLEISFSFSAKKQRRHALHLRPLRLISNSPF